LKNQNRNLGILLLLGMVLAFIGFFLLFFLESIVSIALIIVGLVLFYGSGRKANVFNRERYIGPVPAATAPSPPPLPDTVLVRCDFCGTVQPYSDKCVQCGAPLTRP